MSMYIRVCPNRLLSYGVQILAVPRVLIPSSFQSSMSHISKQLDSDSTKAFEPNKNVPPNFKLVKKKLLTYLQIVGSIFMYMK